MNAMYNEQRKQEFIAKNNLHSNKQSFITFMSRWFKASSFTEELKGKDICEFTSKEIVSFYKSQFIGSYDTLLSLHNYLDTYSTWCNKNGWIPDGINHFPEVKSFMLAECVDKQQLHNKIITREALLDYIDNLPSDDAVLLLGLFEGMNLDDFHWIEAKHLHGNILNIPKGRKLRVSDELARYIVKSANEYTKYGAKGRQIFFNEEDRRVIKDVMINRGNSKETDEEIEAGRMMKYRNEIKILKIHAEEKEKMECPWISVVYLAYSGQIHLLKKWMEKDGISLEDAAKRHINEMKGRYGSAWALNQRYLDKFGYAFE